MVLVLETYFGPQVPSSPPLTKVPGIEPGNDLSQAPAKEKVAAISIVSPHAD